MSGRWTFPSLVAITENLSLNLGRKISFKKKFIGYGFIIFSSLLYIFLTFSNPTRQVSINQDISATYYLSDPLIILTIVLPYIFIIIMSTLSVMKIDSYAKNVSGIIYRKALPQLVKGIIFIISGSVLIQFLVSFGSGRILDLGLGFILFIIYVFILLQTIGYGLIALGSKTLSMFEQE